VTDDAEQQDQQERQDWKHNRCFGGHHALF
jgi:hypothetical protein